MLIFNGSRNRAYLSSTPQFYFLQIVIIIFRDGICSQCPAAGAVMTATAARAASLVIDLLAGAIKRQGSG